MIAINSYMLHKLQTSNILKGSFSTKESTYNRKYKGKREIGEEILFNRETGATVLVKMRIISVVEQTGTKKKAFPFSIYAKFDLIRVIDKGGDVPNLYQDK